MHKLLKAAVFGHWNIHVKVSFMFLPKRGQNKDICKVGGQLEQASFPGFSFHEPFFCGGGGGGGL